MKIIKNYNDYLEEMRIEREREKENQKKKLEEEKRRHEKEMDNLEEIIKKN